MASRRANGRAGSYAKSNTAQRARHRNGGQEPSTLRPEDLQAAAQGTSAPQYPGYVPPVATPAPQYPGYVPPTGGGTQPPRHSNGGQEAAPPPPPPPPPQPQPEYPGYVPPVAPAAPVSPYSPTGALVQPASPTATAPASPYSPTGALAQPASPTATTQPEYPGYVPPVAPTVDTAAAD